MRGAARLLCSLGAALFVLSAAASESLEGKQDWLVLERKGGTPEMVTVLGKLPALAKRARFPTLLTVAWGYAALPNGMPTEDELVRAHELYSNLDRILGQGGVYAMTRTGDGGRTVYYYVRDVATHSEAIRHYFDSLPPISVKVTARDEPGWDSVKEVLDGVR